MKLTAAKCAVGSAKGCTLRLRARGVRPVHLLILRGATGAVARAWAPETRLNGEPFRDARLEAGDRLSVGPVEFEVLAAEEAAPVDPFDAGRTVVLDRRPAAKPPEVPPAVQQSRAAPGRRSRRRTRVRKLADEVRKLRAQIDEFQGRTAAAETTALAADALEAQREAHRCENQQWEATLEGLRVEVDARQQQLDLERTAVEEARRALDEQRCRWEAECEVTRQTLAEQEQSSCRAEEELRVARAEVDGWREQVAAELEAGREELQRRRAELEAEVAARAAVADDQRQLEQRVKEVAARAEELDRREAELAAAVAAAQRAGEVLAESRTAHETQQAEAWREIEEQRAAAANLEESHRATLAEIQRNDGQRQLAEQEFQRRDQELQAAARQSAAQREALEQEESEQVAARAELARREAAATHREIELETARAELQRFRDALDGQQGELEQRQTQLAESVAELERRTGELESQRVLLEQHREHDPAAQAAPAEAEELASQRNALEGEREAWQQEQDRAVGKLEQRAAELDEREAQFTADRRQLEELHAELARRPADTEGTDREEFQRQQQALRLERAELQAARETLEEQQQAFDSRRLETSARLDGEARQLKQEREELEQEREELDHEREALRAMRAASEQPSGGQPDEPWEPEPAHSAAYESQQSLGGELANEETVRSDAPDTLRFVPPGEDEDSAEQYIEEYMAALMKRQQGGSPTPPEARPAARECQERKRAAPAPSAESRPAEEAAAPEPSTASREMVEEMTPQPREMPVRKRAAEAECLTTLRELDRAQSTSAIDTHGMQQTLRRAYGTLITGGVCLAAAFTVMLLANDRTMLGIGMVIVIVGIAWMARSIWAARRVAVSIRQKRLRPAGDAGRSRGRNRGAGKGKGCREPVIIGRVRRGHGYRRGTI